MKGKSLKSMLALGILVASIATIAPTTAYAAWNSNNSNANVNVAQNKGHWQNQNGHWYFIANGLQATGWKKVNDIWYLFDTNGVMQTGMKSSGGKWYCLGNNGAMATGWVLVNNQTWYYFDGNGAMHTGWVLWKGHWYYMDTTGKMVKGWVDYNNKSYYLDSNGSMKTGWYKESGYWYYLQSDGGKYNPSRDGAILQIGNKYQKFYAGGRWMEECQDSTGASYDATARITSPVITAASFSMYVGEGYNPDKFEAKAKDCNGKDISAKITYEGTVNTLVQGNYPVDLRVTDENGASSIFRCTVYVKPTV